MDTVSTGTSVSV